MRKAGRRRLALADAKAKVAGQGYEPVSDPIAAVADVAGRFHAIAGVLEARVAALEELSTDTDTGEQLKAEVRLYVDALKEHGRWSAELAKLGFDERRLALEEWQAELVVAALRLALERSALPEPQRQKVIDAWSAAVVELEKANEPADPVNSKKG